VASVALGRQALQGGLRSSAIGLLIHFGVALFWSALFVFAVRRSRWVRSSLSRWPRAVLLACVYGVFIWLAMTWMVIPAMTHRPPRLGAGYWLQLLGHIPFVALPMVLINRRHPSR
jgi:hypothetical protein